MAPSPESAPAAPDEPPGVRDASDQALVRSLLTGVEAFRWLAWAWLAVLLVISRRELRDPAARPGVAIGLAALALAVTIAISVLRRGAPHRMTGLAVVAAEVAVGCVLEVGDAVAFNGVPHPQSLSSAWPLAGVLTAGIAGGRRAGLAAGLVVAAGGSVGNLIEPGPWTSSDTVSSASTAVLLALAGGIAGLVSTRLRAAERFTALARAREEVARTLHDGVLQTLAVVQHRADDPVLARLAHDQERELREFLFGTPGVVGGGGDLGTRLRAAGARFEDRYGAVARVVVADDTPLLTESVLDALSGAVGEALANAGKHAGAATVTVFAEPGDDALFCSVKDDGTGFDPGAVGEGDGLRRSVRARIAEVGGRVEVDGRPGRGTEVRFWVPTATGR